MKHPRKQFIISLGLAMLLHLMVPLSVWWVWQDLSRPPLSEPVTMVNLVSLPPEPEPEPVKADALAEANHTADQPARPVADAPPPAVAPRRAPPPVPPTPAAPAAASQPDEPVATPKPVAKPARPKPVAKAAPSKPQPGHKPPSPATDDTEESASSQEPLPDPAPEQPASRKVAKAPPRPAPADAPLNLMPSVESVARWDRNRRYQAQSTTRNEEVVDLNTREARYASYFAQVKQRIEWGWVYPVEAKRDGLSGNVGMVFTILRSGELLNVQVVRSSESAILDQAALQAVHKAAPFGPFPEDWSLEKLTIRATFEYIRRGMMWRD
ncbi:MAG: TonB family protein [Magnetococcus sp. DMHC-8]